MRGLYLILIVMFFYNTSFSQYGEKVDPLVIQKFELKEKVSTIIVLKEKANLSGIESIHGKLNKANFVIDRLKATANQSQVQLKAQLDDMNVGYTSYYVVNAIQATLTQSQLDVIVHSNDVLKVSSNLNTSKEEVRKVETISTLRAGVPEWGISKILADSVWQLGVRGEGVIVGGQDTGYDFDLDMLIKKYKGYDEDGNHDHNYNWHDAIHEWDTSNPDSLNPCGYNLVYPCDDHGHGSHTMGTMVGGDTTDIIGVAPDAKWIACRNMERGYGKPSTYIECFEWFINPTDINGENADASKAPHVINNSWGCTESEGCNPSNFAIMEEVVNNVKASGIVVVVSAGNSGNGCESIISPAAIFENSFTVGATRSNDTIAYFSSRGAVAADGSFRMKPNVSAPGVGVRSCVPGNGFSSFSGTSMAGPHVAGVVALMISANPNLAGEVDLIEDIIENTADAKTSDQDCSGFDSYEIPNPVYGFGRINALKAVQAAMDIQVSNEFVDNENGLQLAPNPTSDFTVLKSLNKFEGEIMMEIYSIGGQKMITEKWMNNGRVNKSIEASDYPKGVYLCKITMNKNIYTEKFIKL